MVTPDGHALAFRIPFAAASDAALRRYCIDTLWNAMLERARSVVEVVGPRPASFTADDRGAEPTPWRPVKWGRSSIAFRSHAVRRSEGVV
jgi:hypothetical protein